MAILFRFLVVNSAFGRDREGQVKRKKSTKKRMNTCSYLLLLLCLKYLYLPQALMKTKNETKQQLLNGRLVLYLVLNSITHGG